MQLATIGPTEMKNYFNYFISTVFDDESKIEEKREFMENFVRMFNEEFGRNGIYFEIQETVGIVNDLLFQESIPPMLNVCYRGKEGRVGYIDAQKRTLVHFCENFIDKIEEEILSTKREITTLERTMDSLEMTLKKKRWNIFFLLFRKKDLLSLQNQLKEAKEEINGKRLLVESYESNLQYEEEVKQTVLNLALQLRDYGIFNRSA